MPGVAYANDQSGHFALVTVDGRAGKPRLELTLVREDGAEAYQRTFG
jgi:hypothetical protein